MALSSLGPTGLILATQAQLVAYYTAQYQSIYGADIDLGASTPDGQFMNIVLIQSVLDLQDLLMQIYNSFDPDNAIGTTLDQRVAINGIQRLAGTFTTTPITVVTSQALNLYGLDQSAQPIYTIADNAGNQWQLINTFSAPSGGTYILNFQSAVPGAVLTVPNTITVPVTIVLGVTSVNNPTTYSSLGINEETDAALKVRRQQSVSLASQGYLAGLLAALENINGVNAAFVYENTSGITDSDGVPGHSIWVIVGGTGAAADIAQAIYNKRNAGCGMFGIVTYSIAQPDGSFFDVFWDVVTSEPLFIQFTATSINGTTPSNYAGILSGLPVSFAPGVNQEVNINELATLVQEIDPNTLVTAAGFSTASTGPFTNLLSPSTKKNQFAVSSPNIIILPILLTPSTSNILPSGTVQFSSLGGRGPYTYAIIVNNTGGSINPTTGLYTGGAILGTDTVQVTDSLSNTQTATVTVI